MTLLVFTLDVPSVTGAQLIGTLLEQIPQLIAFGLSFGFVANIWWQHQKILDELDEFEPGLIGINLVLLGAVALVPFPTSLLGSYPTERAAVLSLIGLFIVLSVVYLLLVGRAQLVGAWRTPMPVRVWRWQILTWGIGMTVLIIAAIGTLWHPVTGLLILALSVALGPLRRTSPPSAS